MKEASKSAVTINGVPETMLWTLHNRAHEALREDGLIEDALCVKIYNAIEYDYEKHFGKPESSHGFRSKAFDEALRTWLATNEDAPVIEVGAGLETQFYRINHPSTPWYVVDLPEAIALRETYIPANERLTNIAKSALDFTWLDDIPTNENGKAFVGLQGLLMYFEKEDVKMLLQAVVNKFPQATLMFDTIPHWFSQKTMQGLQKTKHYTTPKMPWGTGRRELKENLLQWLPGVDDVVFVNYRLRGFFGFMFSIFSNLPMLKEAAPAIVKVTNSK